VNKKKTKKKLKIKFYKKEQDFTNTAPTKLQYPDHPHNTPLD